MPSIIAIIPARYASSRFPGKPLIDLGGKSMIQRVYEQTRKAKSIANVMVATDDERIHQHVLAFGGKSVLTASHHPSGTDRCFDALQQQTEKYDYVINVQGDEPFIEPDQIDRLAAALDGTVEIATLAKKINDTETLFNPNVVKVVTTKLGKALYFSRAPIPYLRNKAQTDWVAEGIFFKHIGLYAYRCDVLEKITRLPVSRLEQAESLEQLRWLDNGFSVWVIETDQETMGIDSPEDAARARALLKHP